MHLQMTTANLGRKKLPATIIIDATLSDLKPSEKLHILQSVASHFNIHESRFRLSQHSTAMKARSIHLLSELDQEMLWREATKELRYSSEWVALVKFPQNMNPLYQA
ncbi:hypothetical protein CEXT_22181 [Caerostris extrusa]|uniref:Uncharacterized protein n=1 Tax=Caerostris extrusa TaxID=172846 RepID=A0AAV4UTV0_CAEEX|nr:hypothetical protein CEXT_22181 [Caerostris extrusa]